MQEKQIPFNGITLTPYSDISPDGQLSDSQNMELYNGALRPSTINGKQYTGFEQFVLVFIHTTSNFQNFIFVSKEEQHKLFFSTSLDNPNSISHIGDIDDVVTDIISIGNTLCIKTKGHSLYYILYEFESYTVLGNKIPEIPMNFFLSQKKHLNPDINHDFVSGTISSSDIKKPGTGNGIFIQGNTFTNFKNNVVSQINEEFEKLKKIGIFTQPFLIRYALKLYNDHYIYQSAPILMLPSKMGAMIVVPEYQYESYFDYFVITSRCALGFDKLPVDVIENLKKWEDIIMSVDLFVSNPFNLIDFQDICGQATSEINPWDDFGVFVSPGTNLPASYRQLQSLYYAYLNNYHGEVLLGTGGKYGRPYGYGFKIKTIEENDFNDKIANESNFFKISSIKIKELIDMENNTSMVRIIENSLLNLSQQDKLIDDSRSHYTPTGSHLYAYNKRFLLSGVMLDISYPFKAYTHFANTTGYVEVGYHFIENNFISFDESVDYPTLGSITIDVFLNKNGKKFICRSKTKDSDIKCSVTQPGVFYFYYPDPDAYRAVIKIESHFLIGEYFYYDLPLKTHNTLDGAYWFDGISLQGPERYKQIYPSYEVTTDEDLFYKKDNEIYVSEVDNPFLFPLEGKNIVGAGSIRAISSIVTPLSQGQFGEYPLMALCTDGNYALRINDEGLIIASPPMKRDVCINPNSVTQIDGAIIYVAEKGVMIADGNDIQCISQQLTGVPDKFTQEDENTTAIRPMELFRSCEVIFDYVNQRLIFFDPTNQIDFSLVYSLSSGTWNNITAHDFIKAINIYPHSYIQDDKGNISVLDQAYTFTEEQGNQKLQGLIITRPLKLDTLQFKRLTAFALQGIFKDKQEISLYGSNDATTWRFLGKTQRAAVNNITGRTYKYFRFVIRTSLTPEENISGLRLQYDIRREKRLR